MSEEQYWDRDVTLAKAYREAHRLRMAKENNDMWRQAAYIYEALLRVSPVYHDFAKNPKPLPYIEEPYPLTEKEAEERKVQKMKKAMEDRIKAIESRVAMQETTSNE